MKAEFVQPFIEAITRVLSTMAQTQSKAKKPFVKSGDKAMGDVTGLIGMVGHQTRGSLAISFTTPAILSIASRMLGEKFEEVNDTVADVVGEITNIVTGGAKKALSEQGYAFNMAIPTIVVGKGHSVHHKTSRPVLVVPFDTESGSFFVELCFDP